MAKDPRAEANAYLRAHGIKELFADLGARVLGHNGCPLCGPGEGVGSATLPR